jgi:probable F420-dependent oxidoreductase
MRVYTGVGGDGLQGVAAGAERAERLGFDGIGFGETGGDAFLPCVLAVEHTKSLNVATSVAIAFPRSPMITAYQSWMLQHYSGGRFQLGLGTQVKGHNERRFSVKWTAPGPRLREYLLSLRAIFDSWHNGARLNFRGEHYTFTLMTPAFTPPKLSSAPPQVFISAVGPYNARLAGELCDGISLHGFTTPKYVAEVSLPNLEAGAKVAGRTLKDLAISGGGFVVTGATEEEVGKAYERTRRQISFYASTRTYKRVLDIHGWGDTCLKLHEMSLKNEWAQMPRLITDEMMDAFCVTGTYDTIVPKIRERYGWYASRVNFPLPDATPAKEAAVKRIVAELKAQS